MSIHFPLSFFSRCKNSHYTRLWDEQRGANLEAWPCANTFNRNGCQWSRRLPGRWVQESWYQDRQGWGKPAFDTNSESSNHSEQMRPLAYEGADIWTSKVVRRLLTPIFHSFGSEPGSRSKSMEVGDVSDFESNLFLIQAKSFEFCSQKLLKDYTTRV